MSQGLGVQDAREQSGDLLVVGMAGDCECVGGKRGPHLGVVEVDDGVFLDQVHLLDAGDSVHRELLLPPRVIPHPPSRDFQHVGLPNYVR